MAAEPGQDSERRTESRAGSVRKSRGVNQGGPEVPTVGGVESLGSPHAFRQYSRWQIFTKRSVCWTDEGQVLPPEKKSGYRWEREDDPNFPTAPLFSADGTM